LRVLLLAFITIPITEMWFLITVGQHIGALPTIGLVLLTACIGLALLRYQGAMTLLKARMKMDAGELPAREMADGLFFAVGGALLLTPGFVTDAIGFACLIPGIRTLLIGFFSKHLFRGRVQPDPRSFQTGNADQDHTKTRPNDVLEGDFERHND